MPSFRGEGDVVFAVPEQAGLSQSRARGDDAAVSRSMGAAGIQGEEVLVLQDLDSPGIGFKIVDQPHPVRAQSFSKAPRIDDPGQVRGDTAAIAYRAGHAKGSGIRAHCMPLQELVQNIVQRGMVGAGVAAPAKHFDGAVRGGFHEGQGCLGAAYVACENLH